MILFANFSMKSSLGDMSRVKIIYEFILYWESSHSHAPLQFNLTPIGVFVMQSVHENKKRKLKHSRPLSFKMPVTDLTDVQNLEDSILFPVEEIVQYPLLGCVVPIALSFSPDDNFIAYLFSPDQTLNRKVFLYDLKTSEEDIIFSPPDGGLDESNISPEEKLRRERLRERGLGVTRYDWVKTPSAKRKAIMVPLPAGVSLFDPSNNHSDIIFFLFVVCCAF